MRPSYTDNRNIKKKKQGAAERFYKAARRGRDLMTLLDGLKLLGGLGIFLYGMHLLGESLEAAAGTRLKGLIEALTKNRFMGVLVGMLVTAVIQSSSATTVMVVGFVNAGLMTLSQAVGVIMGANIGTTITGQIIALKVDELALPLIFLGVILMLSTKKNVLRHTGGVLVGLGLLFFGMQYMSGAMKPLRDVQAFRDFMTSFSNPLIGVLAGALFTAVIQSSSASVGILQSLSMEGLIGIDSAIFVLCGMNIGTCVTALLASAGTNRTGKRAAVVHLLFNVIGTALFLLGATLLPVGRWMEAMRPGDPAGQIANAHTIFNIAATIVLFPCAGLMEKLACLIVPGKVQPESEMRLQYLNDLVLSTPTVAVAQVKRELERMGGIALENFNRACTAFETQDESLIQKVEETEKTLNFLNKQITSYMVKVATLEIPDQDAKNLASYFHVVSDFERIGDHAENISEYASARIKQKLHFSPAAAKELSGMAAEVAQIVGAAIRLFDEEGRDAPLKEEIDRLENDIDEQTRILRDRHIERLGRRECDPAAGMYFVDMITNMERVADHATNVGFALLKETRA